MSAMFQDTSTALMGFSVIQPAIGAPLQFFPAMGSKELDELIGAYVPGEATIQEKRAAVSMEFFEHTMATGELFKFFMVPLGSPTTSLVDSGYASSFTSPIMSESQWTPASNPSFSSSERKNRHSSSSKKATPSTDFSHLPGMKIMTRDGQDVTNSASRGCKTKEQRDHAHLMRIIKACDACKKKKVRCDPSHRRSSSAAAPKPAKRAKKVAAAVAAAVAPPPPPQISAEQVAFTPTFDQVTPESSSSFNSTVSEPVDDSLFDWDQFVQYDDEPTEAVSTDYDFFFDPANYFSPTTASSNSFSHSFSNSFSNSFSPSQPIDPVQSCSSGDSIANPMARSNSSEAQAQAHAPFPPYLNPGGEAGNNYVDFNLYSPGSSVDDDLGYARDVAAPPRHSYYENLDSQRPINSQTSASYISQDGEPNSQQLGSHGAANAAGRLSSLFSQEEPAYLDRSDYRPLQYSNSTFSDSSQDGALPRQRIPVYGGGSSPSGAPTGAPSTGLSPSQFSLDPQSLARKPESRARLSELQFSELQFSNSQFSDGDIQSNDTQFSDAQLSGAQLTELQFNDARLVATSKRSLRTSALTPANSDRASNAASANFSSNRNMASAANSSTASLSKHVPHVTSVSRNPISSEVKKPVSSSTDRSVRATGKTLTFSLLSSFSSRIMPNGTGVETDHKRPITSLLTSPTPTTTSSVRTTSPQDVRPANRVINSCPSSNMPISKIELSMLTSTTSDAAAHKRIWSSMIATVAIYAMSFMILLLTEPGHSSLLRHDGFSLELVAIATSFLKLLVLRNILVSSFTKNGGDCRMMSLLSSIFPTGLATSCADMLDLSTQHLSSTKPRFSSTRSIRPFSDLSQEYLAVGCVHG
ncbi:hypothetical protein F5B20DRAFT_539391 [Whalleya microplaca]|nr:hypothetical protein F5B20DRAFT_539391 [Whalleya microplaca]